MSKTIKVRYYNTVSTRISVDVNGKCNHFDSYLRTVEYFNPSSEYTSKHTSLESMLFCSHCGAWYDHETLARVNGSFSTKEPKKTPWDFGGKLKKSSLLFDTVGVK